MGHYDGMSRSTLQVLIKLVESLIYASIDVKNRDKCNIGTLKI